MTHAGEYMQWLECYPEEEFRFKEARSRQCTDPQGGANQPIADKLKHFIEWMLYTVRGGAPSEDGGAQSVDKKQVEKFRRGLVPKVRTLAEGEIALPASPKSAASTADDEFEYKVQNGAAQLDDDSVMRSQTWKMQQHEQQAQDQVLVP